jgi:hypothetical protein
MSSHAPSNSKYPAWCTIAISCGLFLLAFAGYALSPVKTSFDSRVSLHTAMSIAYGEGGDLTNYTAQMPPGGEYVIQHVNGRAYNRYPIGASLLAIPGVVVASIVSPAFLDRLREGKTDRFEMMVASAVGAAAVVIFFWLILSKFQSGVIAAGSTFVFAFCTSMWSTATRGLWGHGPLVLMLVIAMLLLERSRERPDLTQYVGLPLAFAFLSRPTAIVPIVVITGYILLFRTRWLVRYVCWAAVIAVPWMAYNIFAYTRPVPAYYRLGLGAGEFSRWEGFLGNLISPSRGLLVYSPILILSVTGFLIAIRDRDQRPLNATYGLIIILMFVTIAAAPMWWAGHSFGPRFTTDVIPLLVYFTSFNFVVFSRLYYSARVAAITAAVLLSMTSFAMHAQGALRQATLNWNVVPDNIDHNPSRAWDWRDPQFAR